MNVGLCLLSTIASESGAPNKHVFISGKLATKYLFVLKDSERFLLKNN